MVRFSIKSPKIVRKIFVIILTEAGINCIMWKNRANYLTPGGGCVIISLLTDNKVKCFTVSKYFFSLEELCLRIRRFWLLAQAEE